MNHKTLPPGYHYAGTMDFMRDRQKMKALVKLSALLLAGPLALGLLLCPVGPSWRWMASRWYRWPALFAALVAYIPLHEWTHGAAMFALSGVRPRYGLKLPYAYAGSTVWFDRRSHVITALAPVVLWGAGLGAAAAFAPRECFWPVWILQISNLSGSAGDIYCVWALTHMKGDLLIQDTGVRMRIMRKTVVEENAP